MIHEQHWVGNLFHIPVLALPLTFMSVLITKKIQKQNDRNMFLSGLKIKNMFKNLKKKNKKTNCNKTLD